MSMSKILIPIFSLIVFPIKLIAILVIKFIILSYFLTIKIELSFKFQKGESKTKY